MEGRYIKKIWYEFLMWESPFDPSDCNSDVIFELDDGSRWVVTFFTYKNIETIRNTNRCTGECLYGTYFCATDMVLISEISVETIKAVLQEMLSSGSIGIYCSKLS